MIQNAFKGAYTSQISAQNQGINTISSGVKDAATLVAGALGFGGALGEGALAKGAEHTLAGRIGGVGGNIMLATLQQKKDSAQAKENINKLFTSQKDSAQAKENTNKLFTSQEVGETVKAQLGDNPINRAAIKKLGTVFETLVQAKEQEIINKKGNIESSIGEIDPNSELGKRIVSNLDKEDKEK